MRRRTCRALACPTGSPAMWMLPDVGASSPSMILKSVLLPAPLWPMRPNTSPGRTSSVTSSTAVKAPKRRDTP